MQFQYFFCLNYFRKIIIFIHNRKRKNDKNVEICIEFNRKMLYSKQGIYNFSRITKLLHFNHKNVSIRLDFLMKM